MATKKKVTVDDEFGELFSGLHDEAPTKKTTGKPKPAASKAPNKAEDDIFAELEQLGDQPARPHTPRIKEASKRSGTATPPPATSRLSEDKPTLPRKSGESTRSFHASFTPSATSSEYQENEKKDRLEQSASEPEPQPTAAPAPAAAGGGGWWGGLGGIIATASATANAARKQAEAAYTQIQQNEDAKKYLEQVKGNVGYIKNYGKSIYQALYSNWQSCKRPKEHVRSRTCSCSLMTNSSSFTD